MRTRLILFAIALLAALSACKASLPDSYGIYADTACGRLRLEGQRISVRGSLFSQIAGLQGPSGSECQTLTGFIVFLKDVPPSSIHVSRLEFKRNAQVMGLAAETRGDVNLWVPNATVETDIKPVQGHPDMYLAVPRKPLEKGFYALHLGAFGSEIPMLGGQVYDFVMGAAKDFPSYEELVRQRQQVAADAASELLNRMNQIFNSRDYSRLQEAYRPSGQVLVGAELEEYVKGTQLWFVNAGKVLRSEITSVDVSEDASTVQCYSKTTYEKAGEQTESIVLTKIADRFFITSIN